MKKTLTITIGIAILAAVAAAMALKHDAVKNAYFQPNKDKLRQVPADLVIVRPTDFPKADAAIKHYYDNESLARTVGRNASFRDMMAEAYDENPARVVLPPDAPRGGFDFLVTVHNEVREHLRTAIQKKLGFTAHEEMRNTDALILTVQNPALPGMTVSGPNETDNATYRNGRLYLTHQQIGTIVYAVSKGLKRPVVDQTGVTNYFDFSVAWNPQIEKRMNHGSFDAGGTRRVLEAWGLGLESTNMPVEMLIVEKAR